MQVLGFVIILAICSNCQISPNWIQSNYVQARDYTVKNTEFNTSGSFTVSVTYNTTMTSPTVVLSIRQFRTATNDGNIGIVSKISGMPTNSGFVHNLIITSPTTIWLFVIRYFAFEKSFPELSFIQFGFQEGHMSKNFLILDAFNNKSKNSGIVSTINGHDYAVAVFTTGFVGTIGNTYFQANVTWYIDGNVTYLKIDQSLNAVITNIAFYTLAADLTYLAEASQVFVETAITFAQYGVQKSFYSPFKVLYEGNYMSGLLSYSIMNNVQYNFTISGLNFSTFNDSFYNEVSHFNLWIRQCPSPTTYFNKVDSLCYAICPTKTYANGTALTCTACHYSCTTCVIGGNCSVCQPNRVINSATGKCNCGNYFYESYQVCKACHYSCQTCTLSGQYFNCLSCNGTNKRSISINLTPIINGANYSCDCDLGYEDVGVARCSQYCGDGRVIELPCDDGNTVDEDGCSSTCSVQTGYTCTSSAYSAWITPNPSNCKYTANMTIEVSRIQKQPNSNTVLFYLKVNPFVSAMSQLTTYNFYSNISGATKNSITVQDGLIVCNISYSSSIEGLPILIGLKPSLAGAFSAFAPQNTTVVAKANNGLKLQAYTSDNYDKASKLGNSSYIVGLTFLFLALIFCYGDWKELGLQLFFAIQYCFMSYAILTYCTPHVTKFLYVKSIMGWNDLKGQKKPPYLSVPVTQHMGFSLSYEYNFNIMAIFPGFALLMYGFYRLGLFIHQRRRRKGKTSKEFEQILAGRILKFFKFEFFVYWMLFNMQQVFTATVIQFQGLQNPGVVVLIIFCLAGILVSIFGLFTRPNSLKPYRQTLFHKSYGNKTFLMVLISTILMDVLLLLGILVNKYIFYVSLICPLVVLVYVVGRKPFKLIWNNIRLAIIQCCLLASIGLQIGILNTEYSTNYNFSVGILALISIAVLATFLVLIYNLVKNICRLRKEDDADISSRYSSSQKEEEQINEKVREAGYALVHGYTSRLPTAYEMSNIPVSSRLNRSKLESFRVGPSPRQQSIKNKKISGFKTRTSPQQTIKDSSGLRKRMTYIDQTPPASKRKLNRTNLGDELNDTLRNQELTPVKQETGQQKKKYSNKQNPYQQILEQTANVYK